MEELLLNLSDPTLHLDPDHVKGQRRMVQLTKDKTKWKKKGDARNFLSDVQNTLTSDSQEAKELRMQFFPNRSLADNVARANLLIPAAVAVPAIGDVSEYVMHCVSSINYTILVKSNALVLVMLYLHLAIILLILCLLQPENFQQDTDDSNSDLLLAAAHVKDAKSGR